VPLGLVIHITKKVLTLPPNPKSSFCFSNISTLELILNKINLTATHNKQQNIKVNVIWMRVVSFTNWPAYHRRSVSLTAGLDVLEQRKISCSSRKSTPDCPAHIPVSAPPKLSSHRAYKIRRSASRFHVLNKHLQAVTTQTPCH